jgi:hypothetical protein
MVEHTCKSNYSPFRVKLNIFVIVGSILILALSNTGMDVVKMVKAMLMIFIICQWHYILNIVHEMAKTLKIRIFRVKDKVSSCLNTNFL